MVQDRFLKRKTDVLSKKDKSHIGKWDKHILELCNKINSHEDYYTTSSCSGRIVLIIDQTKKESDLFVKVYHDKISFNRLKEELEKLVRSRVAHDFFGTKFSLLQDSLQDRKVKTLTNFNFGKEAIEKASVNKEVKSKNIKFKFEPCALHVACRTLKDAQELYDKAKLAGWKRSGIIATNNRFMVELNSTEKLEFPIIQNKKILVNEEFLKIVVEEANRKLEKSWMKIEKLSKMIK